MEYILGARERNDVLLRRVVLTNEGPFVPLLIERQTSEIKDKPVFEIDAGKFAQDARFDGIFVLRTNAKINAGAGKSCDIATC